LAAGILSISHRRKSNANHRTKDNKDTPHPRTTPPPRACRAKGAAGRANLLHDWRDALASMTPRIDEPRPAAPAPGKNKMTLEGQQLDFGFHKLFARTISHQRNLIRRKTLDEAGSAASKSSVSFKNRSARDHSPPTAVHGPSPADSKPISFFALRNGCRFIQSSGCR